MIRLDCTQFSVVVVCISCGWRSLAGDKSEGWRRAVQHEKSQHPGQSQASGAARVHAHRNSSL